MRSTSCWILICVLLLTGASEAFGVAPRGGTGAATGSVLPYAPGRVIVRLTEAAYRASQLEAVQARNDVAPDAVTGLAGVDALAREAGVSRIARAHGPFADMALAERVGAQRIFRFETPPDTDIPAFAALLAADPDVEAAAPDWRIHLDWIPNDPTYPANWGHNNQGQFPAYDWYVSYDHTLAPVGMPGFDADADLAWDLPAGFGMPSVTIAIIDTGVDLAHPDLMLVPGYDYGDNDPSPHDDAAFVAGHGTCCAGIAAAISNNGLVAAGVAGGCTIMPLKVADSGGNLYLSYAANALYHAANNGAQIASMSFSTTGITSDPQMDPAMQFADALGVTLVAAAGNDNNGSLDYPANSPYVIAVGAASPCGERKRSSNLASECDTLVTPDPLGYTCDGERWWGSNYGINLQDAAGALDVLAPTMLPTTDISGAAGYQLGNFEPWFNGTSCSAPYVAGVCALVLSADPMLTPNQVRSLIVSTAMDVVSIESAPGWDRFSGYGLVNAFQAVAAAMPPAAAFFASPTSGCQPLIVAFNDMSGGYVQGWQWDFGDGGLDFTQHPTHHYTMPGTYTVTLTVTGPGGVDTLIQTDLITVDPPALPDFAATLTSGPAPLTTTFNDATLNDPTNWQWDFGDGEPSDSQNPTHTYLAPGFFTVTLTANNACGGGVMVKTDYIHVLDQLPVAAFTASDTAGCAPLDVDFTYVPLGGPVDTWAWDFGDGGSSSLENPSHTYAVGVYDVTLIVSNASGADTLLVTGRVAAAAAPSAAFSAAPTAGADTLTVVFTDQSTGVPTSWAWDFGDGGASSIASPSHTYAAPGRYTVSLTVANVCAADTLAVVDQIVIATTTGADEVQRRFALGPNYPNPFNPATTFEFSLAQPGHARLEIFDASGRTVSVLVDEQREAGPHRVVWRPERSASGIYFVKLEANGSTAMRRVVLLR